MPVALLLQRFVDDELARTPQLFDQVRTAALAQLQRAGPAAGDAPNDASARLEAARALQLHGARFAARYVDELRALVEADLAVHDRAAHAPPGAGADGLALMDESLVESDIEISRAAMLIDSAVEWEQRELQTFTSALRGEAHVGADSNPLRPALVSRALWQATDALALPPAQRVQVLRAMAAAFGGALKRAYAAAASRIEAQGVEPSLYRTVLLAPGSVAPAGVVEAGADPARRSSGDAAGPGTLRGLLARLPGAAAGEPGEPSARLEQALARLGARARRADDAAPAVAKPAAAPESKDALPQAPQAADPRLPALMSRLFDALRADPALPAPATTAIARLQASVLRVAQRDPALLDTQAHPTWRLIDRVASAGQQSAAAGPARLAAFADACSGLTDEIARRAEPDAALYRQGLARLEALTAEQMRQALQAAQTTIAALQRSSVRMHLQAQVRTRLEDQFVRSPVGAATRRYLLGPWAEGLAETIERTGPDSEATAALTRSVDDLLWSLHPPAHPASRARLVRLLPGLLARLRESMTQRGLAPGEQQAVLDELEASHGATLWPRGGAAGTGPQPAAETPEDIVRRLREEVVDAAPTRRDFGDSVLDLSMLDTVPAGLLPADGAGEPSDGAARHAPAAVAALAPGSAVRLLLQGRWTDAQLLWRSESGDLLLFADPAGSTRALTRRALERLHAEGLARFDPPGSAVQRAIKRLLCPPSPT